MYLLTYLLRIVSKYFESNPAVNRKQSICFDMFEVFCSAFSQIFLPLTNARLRSKEAGRRHLFLQWSYFSNVLLHRYFLLSQFESFHNKLSALELGGNKKEALSDMPRQVIEMVHFAM